MLRPWMASHWRRVVMAALLWLVLVMTVGLAALVTWHKHQVLRVRLEGRQTFGRLRVSLPWKWTVSSGASQATVGDVVFAEEISRPVAPSAAPTPARRLTIARQRCGGMVTPLEQLLRTGMLQGVHDERELVRGCSNGDIELETTDVAGWPGVLAHIDHERVACAILPGDQALVVRLDGAGVNEADRELMRQMTESDVVQIAGLPATTESGGSLALADGVALEVPGHLFKFGGDDPNRISWRLVTNSWSADWLSVELIPCALLGDDGGAALRSMLLARDRDWKGGPVKSAGPHAWRTEPVTSGAFCWRAYLLSDADAHGQALLAVWHGECGIRPAQLDDAWAQLARSVRFTRPRDLDAQLRGGADEAARLRHTGLDVLLPPHGEQNWWLWDQAENTDRVRWMHLTWRCSGDRPHATWQGRRQTQWSDPGGAVATDQTWFGGGDMGLYNTTGTALEPSAGTQAPLLEQQLIVEPGRVQQIQPPAQASWSAPVPDSYLPGGWLPMLLGRISHDIGTGTVILRSESFVGCDALPVDDWLTLVVSHDEQAPVKPDEQGKPMECLTVQVNGSGQLSRWYFAADGTLRYIDFADGLRTQQESPPPQP